MNAIDRPYRNSDSDGQAAPPVTQVTQESGLPALVVSVAGLTITDAGTVQVMGEWPLIFAVFGDAVVGGNIEGGAVGPDAGAGVRSQPTDPTGNP